MQFFPALTPSASAGAVHKQLDANTKCLMLAEVQEVTEISKHRVKDPSLFLPEDAKNTR